MADEAIDVAKATDAIRADTERRIKAVSEEVKAVLDRHKVGLRLWVEAYCDDQGMTRHAPRMEWVPLA